MIARDSRAIALFKARNHPSNVTNRFQLMVKRVAEEQLAKDTALDEAEVIEAPSLASEDVLAQRKILKPRGRNFQFQKPPNSLHATKTAKVLALNQQFKQSIQEAVDADALDLTPIALKYVEYHKSLAMQNSLTSDRQQALSGSSNSIPKLPQKASTATLFHNSKFKLHDTISNNSSNGEGPAFTFNKTISDPIFKLDSHNKPSTTSEGPSQNLQSTGDVLNTSTSQKANDDDSYEEPSGGNSPVFEPVTKLTQKVDSVITGEEEESLLFACKSKVFLLNTHNKQEPYTNVGVGELKVLQSEKRCRILVRSEGSSRVILNALLLSEVNYVTTGTNIKVPSANQDGSFLIYLVRVKTTSLAEEVCQLLNQKK